MATVTGADYFGVVYPGGWSPAEGGMAGFTTVGCIDVIAVFACGNSAVMTARAAAGDTAVIKCRTSKTVGIVTVVTGIAALDMIS